MAWLNRSALVSTLLETTDFSRQGTEWKDSRSFRMHVGASPWFASNSVSIFLELFFSRFGRGCRSHGNADWQCTESHAIGERNRQSGRSGIGENSSSRKRDSSSMDSANDLGKFKIYRHQSNPAILSLSFVSCQNCRERSMLWLLLIYSIDLLFVSSCQYSLYWSLFSCWR